MKKDDCDGCLMMVKYHKCAYSRIKNCPCVSCLVKMMCRVKCRDLKIKLTAAGVEGYETKW